jgi:hypothetical protein
MVTQAEYNKTITLNEIADVEIDNWDSGISIYNNTSSFTHDMRNA